jgi:hypothetical protein
MGQVKGRAQIITCLSHKDNILWFCHLKKGRPGINTDAKDGEDIIWLRNAFKELEAFYNSLPGFTRPPQQKLK